METNKVIGALALIAALSGSVSARANMLVNGGLEVTSDQLAADSTLVSSDGLIHASPTTHSTALTGWTIGGDSIDIVPNTYWQDTQGTYSVDLIGTPGVGSIQQTVSGLTPGNMYELSFDFSVNPGEGSHGGESSFAKWLDVESTNSSVPAFYFTGTPSPTQTPANMQYVHRAIDFTATASTTTITFAAMFPGGLPTTFTDGTPITASSLYTGPVIDNIDLENITRVVTEVGVGNQAAAPEPTSLAIFGLGGVMLLRRRRSI